MDIEVESQRHPFRFMVKFLVFVGIIYMAGRFMAKQKENWSGITEAEARAKIESKLARVGEDKAADIASQIVTALTEKGVIKAEETDDEVVDVTKEAGEAASDDAEAVEEVTAD